MIRQEPAAILLGEEPVKAPCIVRECADIQKIHDKQIARFGTLHTHRTAQEMHDAQVDIANIGGRIVILDEAAGPVIAFDDKVLTRLDRGDHWNVRMPAIVNHVVVVGGLRQVDLDEGIRHSVPFSCLGLILLYSQITRDFFLIKIGACVLVHDIATFQNQDTIGDIEREAEHLFRCDNAQATFVPDTF